MPGPDKHKPCKDCTDRAEMGLCHDSCPDYKAIQEENRKKRIYTAQMNNGHIFPPTVKYHKSSGCYRAPKGINHKKSG